MNTINLSMLEITLQSEFSLRDDGFVDDIESHAKKVYLESGKSLEEFYKDWDPPAEDESEGGLCIVDDERKAIIICYKRHANPEDDIAVRAHEETHALIFLDRIALLQERLGEIGLGVDLSKCPAERLAGYGAFYALKRRGLSGMSVSPNMRNDIPIWDFYNLQKPD